MTWPLPSDDALDVVCTTGAPMGLADTEDEGKGGLLPIHIHTLLMYDTHM